MAYLRGWLVMVACFAVLWAGAFALRTGAARSNASGQCEGIGFGCSLTPYDGWTFAMLVLGIPATAIAVLVGSLWLLRRRPDSRPVVRGLVAAGAGLAAVLLVGVAFAAVESAGGG